MPLNSCTVAPNTAFEHTTWSPLLRWTMAVVRIADMPEAVATQLCAPSRAANRSWNMDTVGLVKREYTMPLWPPVKRAAACAALSKTKLEVRNSASACSLNSVRRCPARTPSVARSAFFSIKKPRLICELSGPGFSRHALAAFITRPQAVGSNRREKASISGCEVQIELCAFGVVPRVARGIAPDLDVAQVVAGDIPRDVVPVEARGLEVLQPRIGAAHRVLQRVKVLVDERIGADLSRHLLLAAMRGDQLGAGRHVDAVDIGEAHRRRRRGEEHLARARFARHLHDLAAGGAAHDRVVHQQHVLASELHRHRVQLLAHRALAHRLPGHDEGAADVAVLDEALAVGHAQAGRELQRRRAAGV